MPGGRRVDGLMRVAGAAFKLRRGGWWIVRWVEMSAEEIDLDGEEESGLEEDWLMDLLEEEEMLEELLGELEGEG